MPPPPGGGHWGPGALHWPHLPHLPHLPLARPRRRTAGITVAAVGLIVAVGAGVALGGGIGGSGHDEADGKGFGSTAPARPASPSPSSSPGPSDPGAAPDPGATSGAPLTPVPTDPDEGVVYQGIRLPAGSSLALRNDPPLVQRDSSGGSFGFTTRGDAFFAEPHQARLALPDPQVPPTLDACRAGTGAQLTTVPRQSVSEGGGRICVHLIDGTIALVTLRQFSPPSAPQPYAVVDVTVWRLVDQSAESDL